MRLISLGEGRASTEMNWSVRAHSVRATTTRDSRQSTIWLRAALLLVWLYVAFLGGTWAVISSFWIRLICQLLLIAIIAAWLLVRMRRGGRIQATSLDHPLLVFLTITLLATVFSINQRLSLEAAVMIGGYALLYLVLVSLAASRKPDLLAVIVAGGTIVSLAAIAEISLHYFGLAPGLGYGISWPSVAPSGQWQPPMTLRPWLVAGNPNVLAGYLAPLLPLVFVLFVNARSRSGRIAISLCLVLIAIGTVVSVSRGGLIAALAGILSLPVLALASHQRDWVVRHFAGFWRKVLLAGVVCGSTLLIIWHFLPGAGAQYGTAGVRVELWGYALDMVRARPILGFGPDTFGLMLLSLRSPLAPAADLLPHPHNVYLGLAAESGLLGLAACLVLAICVGRTWWRATIGQSLKEHMIHTALMAGLVAMAAHGIVEDFRVTPLIVIHGVVFVALIVAMENRATSRRPGSHHVRWLLLPGLALLAVALFTSYTRWEFDQGARLADSGHFTEAASLLDTASHLDPGITYYREQTAFAKAMSDSSSDDTTRAFAIQDYATAISADDYAPNHANLAALLWDAGRQEDAIAEMTRAVGLRPGESVYRINLANYYRRSGDADRADAQYLTLLVNDPGIVASVSWQRVVAESARINDLVARAWSLMETLPSFDRGMRRGDLASAQGRYSSAAEQYRLAIGVAPSAVEPWRSLGIALLQAGQTGQAMAALQLAATLAPGDVGVHAALAQALAGDGQIAQAEREARVSLFIQSNAAAHLVLARIARGQANWTEADYHYLATLPARSSYLAYGLTVWRRPGIKSDFLPLVSSPDVSSQEAALFTEYGDFLRQRGRNSDATEVARRWQAYQAQALFH